MRTAGPGHRVSYKARDQTAAIITRWLTDPARYTEVAGTLADIVSHYADQHGPDGWRVIVDQWLQSPAFGGSGFRVCYRLFYSRSEHYNPDWADQTTQMPKVQHSIRVPDLRQSSLTPDQSSHVSRGRFGSDFFGGVYE